MEIFISWSGERSREIANQLRAWIPRVIQRANPYVSSMDMKKGIKWFNEISKKLEQPQIGLICLTKENLTEPWIMFEAGALSNAIQNPNVCPMLFDVEIKELKPPLSEFQATKFAKEDILRFLETVNARFGNAALKSEILNESFEKFWGDLEPKVRGILSKPFKGKEVPARTEKDILSEILEVVRDLKRNELLPTPYQIIPGSNIWASSDAVSPVLSERMASAINAGLLKGGIPTCTGCGHSYKLLSNCPECSRQVCSECITKEHGTMLTGVCKGFLAKDKKE